MRLPWVSRLVYRNDPTVSTTNDTVKFLAIDNAGRRSKEATATISLIPEEIQAPATKGASGGQS